SPMKTCRECINIAADARVIYLEMAKDFERRGMKDIYPEAAALQDAEVYENEVVHLLNERLAQSRTGRALLTAILAARPRFVLIRPMDDLDTDTKCLKHPEVRGWNPQTGWPVSAATRGFTANALVLYTPDALDSSDRASPGMRVDEVLLHELYHGLGKVTGK